MAGILNWDLGDVSNNVNANSLSHTYSSGGIKNIKVYKGTADTSISYINIPGGLIGTFDLSTLRSLSNVQCPNNTKLTSLILPIGSTVTWSYIDFNSCDITGTLDATSAILCLTTQITF